MKTLLDINNRMMNAANELRDAGFRDEAARMSELALGVWTVMCSVSRAARQTETTS